MTNFVQKTRVVMRNDEGGKKKRKKKEENISLMMSRHIREWK